MEGKHDAGKGDSFRRVDRKVFEENYKEIYGEKEIKVWTPDPQDDPRGITPLKDKDEIQ